MVNIILTGAGFSANFGLPLAKVMYQKLFNMSIIQANPKIRELFLDDKHLNESNYEKIYEHLIDVKNSNNENVSNVIEEIWKCHCESFEYYSKDPKHKDGPGFKSLLEKMLFTVCSKSKGILFTLNQDLFIERQFTNYFSINSLASGFVVKLLNMSKQSHPGTLKRLGISDQITKSINLAIKDNLLDVAEENVNNAKAQFNAWYQDENQDILYIKLHGSLDLKYENTPLLIAGENKESKIGSCELLSYYYEVLEKVSTLKGHLLIIGYGFQDEHINKQISSFLKCNEENKLLLVGQETMKDFFDKNKLSNPPELINLIKQRLVRYYSDGLTCENLKLITKYFNSL